MKIAAVGLSDVETNAAWVASLAYEYEVWSDPERVLLEHYGAVDPTEDLPLRHAFILDAEGRAIVFHQGAVSVGADPGAVLEDCAWLLGGEE